METTLIKVPDGIDASMPRKNLTLMDLPNELLIMILAYLPDSGPLASLALVSHGFSNLVDKIIYDSICFHIECPDKEHTETLQWNKWGQPPYQVLAASFDRFIRLREKLEANSNLAKRVRSLSLSIEKRRFCRAPFFEDRRLITLLPSLQHLSFCPPDPIVSLPDDLIVRSLRLDFPRPPPDLGDMASLFHGTSLRHEMKSIAQQMWLPRLRKRCSISQKHGLLDGNFVGMLLSTVKGLNTFAGEADHPCPGHEGHNLRTAMDCMARGLQANNESLKELFIATSVLLRFGTCATYLPSPTSQISHS